MKATRKSALPNRRARQRGFSILELTIAMVLAVFLLAGLFTIMQGTRHTSTDQTALAQLQDNERIALSILTDVVQTAGYFPGAPNNVLTTELAVTGSFVTAGQSIVATSNGTQGDTLVVRYETATGDGTSSCLGNTNTTGGNLIYVNTFSVNANNQLTCSDGVTTTAVPLVNGVTSFTVQYAVNTSATVTNSNCPADSYLTTAQMVGATNPGLFWSNICAIRVILTFVNPLYQPVPGGPTTPGQPTTLTISRVISIMTKAGVNSVTTQAS